MNARTEDQVGGRIAVKLDDIGVVEYSTVAIGGDPHQRQALSLGYGSPLNGDVLRRGAWVGDKRPIRPQNLFDCCGNECRIVPQSLLKLDILREMQNQDTQAGCDSAMPGRPVPQDAHDLVVVEPRAVHFGGQQRVCSVGRCITGYGATHIQVGFDVFREEAGEGLAGG